MFSSFACSLSELFHSLRDTFFAGKVNSHPGRIGPDVREKMALLGLDLAPASPQALASLI
jgi:hypothetical protein